MDAELRQQPASDEGAHDSDDQVADETEAGSLYDLAGKPSRNQSPVYGLHVLQLRPGKTSPLDYVRPVELALMKRIIIQGAMNHVSGVEMTKTAGDNGRYPKEA
jgi:hypothetical protein